MRGGKRWRGSAVGAVAPLALFVVLVSSVPANSENGSPDAEQVLAGLQSWLDGTRDLQGSFRQALLSGAFGTGVEERGRIYVKRPGRMRWDYRDPESKVAIIDGDKTWLYVRDEHQLVLGSLEEDGSLLPSLIAAERPLRELFEAELVESTDPADENTWLIRLRPRAAEDDFESVVVSLRARDFAIEAAEVLDAAGNRMLYRFSKFRRNEGLPDELFHFDPPRGTTVVGSH